MSTKPPAEPEETEATQDGWSHLSEDERAELRAKYTAARARRAEGRGIPMDEVLPRYRQAG
jgi:hypothetical protein